MSAVSELATQPWFLVLLGTALGGTLFMWTDHFLRKLERRGSLVTRHLVIQQHDPSDGVLIPEDIRGRFSGLWNDIFQAARSIEEEWNDEEDDLLRDLKVSSQAILMENLEYFKEQLFYHGAAYRLLQDLISQHYDAIHNKIEGSDSEASRAEAAETFRRTARQFAAELVQAIRDHPAAGLGSQPPRG